jgi:hypothetical protein
MLHFLGGAVAALANDECEQVVAKQRLRGIFIPTFHINYCVQPTDFFVLCFYTEMCY